jgi:hypothetical protein
MLDFLKAGFLMGCDGLAMTLLVVEVLVGFSTPLEEAGVPSVEDFLVKKPMILRCLESEFALELAFLSDGGGLAGV